ncbi:unnamed protein product [Linum trigynum]|uniref:Uncharacterized protein n=1 Tax=Linum trigynum TaxID=586398 RepID=A0AAV2F1T8_9ROSI
MSSICLSKDILRDVLGTSPLMGTWDPGARHSTKKSSGSFKALTLWRERERYGSTPLTVWWYSPKHCIGAPEKEITRMGFSSTEEASYMCSICLSREISRDVLGTSPHGGMLSKRPKLN